MQTKTLPLFAAVLLLGSASVASAQQSNAPMNQQPQATDEQLLSEPGRQPLRRSSPMQGGAMQEQMPSGTTGLNSQDQGSRDRGAAGFQNEPDHSRATANE